MENLRAEGIADELVHFVGNTMIDSLVAMESRFRAAAAADRLGARRGDYLLVTLHRPALVDGPLLPEVLERLGEVAAELPVVFPVHPRTRKMMQGLDVHPGITLIDPVGYLDFLSLEADAGAMILRSSFSAVIATRVSLTLARATVAARTRRSSCARSSAARPVASSTTVATPSLRRDITSRPPRPGHRGQRGLQFVLLAAHRDRR